MSRPKFSAKHDQGIADNIGPASGFAPEFMCSAHGCPNRWSVEGGGSGHGRLCSAHAWADPHRWPEITQQQQWDEVERAQRRAVPEQPRHVDHARVGAWLDRRVTNLRDNAESNPKAWAIRLRDRELAGEKLHRVEAEAWRVALAQPAPNSTPTVPLKAPRPFNETERDEA